MDPIIGERCVMCPYMGTNYCMDLCEEWEDMPLEDCDLECGACPHALSCPCTKHHLPREISIDSVKYFLTNPNIPPFRNTELFQERYHRPPEFLTYIEEWGIFVMGPVDKTVQRGR